MSVSPVTLLEHFVSELESILPPEYRIHKSYGISGNEQPDSEMLYSRYGADINGDRMLRGWWISWDAMMNLKQKIQGPSTHLDTFGFHGIYEIRNGDSDAMTVTAYNDIHAIVTHWEQNPTFIADNAAITVIPPSSEAGPQYEGNTDEGILLAGANVYQPVLSVQAYYEQTQ